MAGIQAMQTPDGAWRVEIYKRPRTRDSWMYRLINVANDNVVEDLSIATVQRLLAEAGVDLADLVEVADGGTARKSGAA